MFDEIIKAFINHKKSLNCLICLQISFKEFSQKHIKIIGAYIYLNNKILSIRLETLYDENVAAARLSQHVIDFWSQKKPPFVGGIFRPKATTEFVLH